MLQRSPGLRQHRRTSPETLSRWLWWRELQLHQQSLWPAGSFQCQEDLITLRPGRTWSSTVITREEREELKLKSACKFLIHSPNCQRLTLSPAYHCPAHYVYNRATVTWRERATCIPSKKNKNVKVKTTSCSLISDQNNTHRPKSSVTHRTLGILAPSSWYCLGFFRNWTNSKISSLASSQPATSFSLTLMPSLTILALDSVILKMLFPFLLCHPPGFHCLELNMSKPSSPTSGSKITRNDLDKQKRRRVGC